MKQFTTISDENMLFNRRYITYLKRLVPTDVVLSNALDKAYCNLESSVKNLESSISNFDKLLYDTINKNSNFNNTENQSENNNLTQDDVNDNSILEYYSYAYIKTYIDVIKNLDSNNFTTRKILDNKLKQFENLKLSSESIKEYIKSLNKIEKDVENELLWKHLEKIMLTKNPEVDNPHQNIPELIIKDKIDKMPNWFKDKFVDFLIEHKLV